MDDVVTPQDLARELGRTDREIRVFLRAEFGRLAERGETRWQLTPEQAAAVRGRFARRA
ncbi:hypothetical protein [Oerskovia sp. KBS0722]|uniref:hypothetical protein n=1 Tax=Oerskovia sp. KBS0722 TaxID=1179673 RepID=UPI00143DAAF7|nr:hypothetical protein [Oerskovia sp. KBS0722]